MIPGPHTTILPSAHRHLLRIASAEISLPEIMGTKEGIKALTEFLKKTGAFTKNGQPLPNSSELPDYEDEPDPRPDPEPPDLTQSHPY